MAKRISTPRRWELLILGKRLKHWRKAKGWTQEKLAFAAGLDYSHYNEIENGKLNPGALTLFAIAQTLEISPALFFLPVTEACQRQKSPAHRAEVQELRLSSQLADPEWVDLYCDFIDLSLRVGAFEISYQWLQMLSEQHPNHWRIHYSWARYFVFKHHPPETDKGLNTEPAEQTELQLALLALEKACQQADRFSREKVLTDPMLRMLQHYFPEQWQDLFHAV